MHICREHSKFDKQPYHYTKKVPLHMFHYIPLCKHYFVTETIFRHIKCDLFLFNRSLTYSCVLSIDYKIITFSIQVNIECNGICCYWKSLHYSMLQIFGKKNQYPTRSIQRTQTPPRLWPLTLWCDLDLSSRSRKLMSLDVAYCIVLWYQVWCLWV